MANKYTVSEIRKLNLAAGGKFFLSENMKSRHEGQSNDRVSDFEVVIFGGKIVLQYKASSRKVGLCWEFNEKTHRLSPFALASRL